MRHLTIATAVATAMLVAGCGSPPADTAATTTTPAQSASDEWVNPYPQAEAPGERTDTAEELANKRVAIQYFDALYNAKDLPAALALATPEIHLHNPAFADGRDGLAALIQSLQTEHPNAQSEVKRVLTDGDLVFLHSHAVRQPGTLGFIAGDMLRIQDGKVAEQWSILHPIPEKPHKDNPNNAFCAGAELHCPSTVTVSKEDEARNKQLAREFYDAALNEKNWPKARSYMGDRYTQHSLYMQDGHSGLEELVDRVTREHPQNLGDTKRALADGDLVVMHLHVTRNRGHLGWSVFEIIRMENGKAVEHWDMFRTVPEVGGEKLF